MTHISYILFVFIVLRLISSPNFENLIFILVSNISFIVRKALVRKRLELLDVLLINVCKKFGNFYNISIYLSEVN